MLMGFITTWTNPNVTAEAVAQGQQVWDYTAAQLILALFGFLSLILALFLKHSPNSFYMEIGNTKNGGRMTKDGRRISDNGW